uniref:Uncharacterized protein n=1 Tax=Arundo donax TaxID=35708 RepID=A0A0A9RGV4_ARUDO
MGVPLHVIRVPDRRLHGVPLLQQHLHERGGDVAVPSGHACRLLVLTRRHGSRRPPLPSL